MDHDVNHNVRVRILSLQFHQTVRLETAYMSFNGVFTESALSPAKSARQILLSGHTSENNQGSVLLCNASAKSFICPFFLLMDLTATTSDRPVLCKTTAFTLGLPWLV